MARLATVIALLALISVAQCGFLDFLRGKKQAEVQLVEEKPLNPILLEVYNKALTLQVYQKFVIEDIHTKNISAVFDDILVLIPALETVMKDQFKYNVSHVAGPYLNSTLRYLYQPCLENIDRQHAVLKNIVAIYREKGLAGIFKIATELTRFGKSLYETCLPVVPRINELINTRHTGEACQNATRALETQLISSPLFKLHAPRNETIAFIPVGAEIVVKFLDRCFGY